MMASARMPTEHSACWMVEFIVFTQNPSLPGMASTAKGFLTPAGCIDQGASNLVWCHTAAEHIGVVHDVIDPLNGSHRTSLLAKLLA